MRGYRRERIRLIQILLDGQRPAVLDRDVVSRPDQVGCITGLDAGGQRGFPLRMLLIIRVGSGVPRFFSSFGVNNLVLSGDACGSIRFFNAPC